MRQEQNNILFGKYEIISTLGTGSFGTVYLSKHIILECYRAIKIIPKTTSMTDSLLHEAQLLKSLQHPGIPCLYDIEEDEIVKIDAEQNLILVKGAVPGPKKALVMLKNSVKAN